MIVLVNHFWRKACARCNPYWKAKVVVINIWNMVIVTNRSWWMNRSRMECPFVMYIIVPAKTKADINPLRENIKLSSLRSLICLDFLRSPGFHWLPSTSLHKGGVGSQSRGMEKVLSEQARRRRVHYFIIIIRVRQKGSAGMGEDKVRKHHRLESPFPWMQQSGTKS